MRNIFRVIIAGLVLLSLSLWVTSPVNANGLGVGPEEIEIYNALRGGEYERTITVHNRYEKSTDFELSATGEMSSWIYFYEQSDPTTPVEKITVPGKDAQFKVKFKIPADAANGSHTSTILVATIPTEAEGQTVKLELPVAVKIEVTGTQILTGEVRSITTRGDTGDTEINYLLRIDVEFKNTGNVIAKPQIDVNITKDGALIDNLTFAEAEVEVKAREFIPVEWDTTGSEIGDYVANVTVSLGGDVLHTEALRFSILPTGTLTRLGELAELSYEGQLEIGRVVKILATFENTGQIDTTAKFVGEVYRDGGLIDILNSEQILVPVEESAVLKAYLKLNEPGRYNIKGYVVYDGKTTDVREVSFEVASNQSWFESQGLLFAGIAGGVAVIAIAGIVAYRRSNSKAKSKS